MKKAILILGIVILAILILFALRFIVGGSEDDWICVDNEWVKHGMPSAPMPTEPCGEEQQVGGEKDEHGCMLMAGYTWCESKQKCLREWEEPCEQEEIFNLLTELKDSTGIKFSGIHDAEFKWIVRVDPEIAEETVAGKGFDVERISNGQYDSVESFLIDRGFKKDPYNMTDGTISGLKGYKKDQIVCTVSGGSTGYQEATGQWIPHEPNIKDVTVKCGKLEITNDAGELSQCAKDGETFSKVSDKYLDSCCEGLKEWMPIPDTRLSIADVCYEVGPPSKSNIGFCIKCGDGACENHLNYDENPCNCPEDCKGKNKSHFYSIEKFCQSNDWKISLAKACKEAIKDFPICKLCNF